MDISNQAIQFNIPLKYVLVTSLVIIIFTFIFLLIVSYFVLKALKIQIDDNGLFFHKYSKRCQAILDTYGDYKLTQVYLVRQPFSKLIHFTLNLLTFYEYQNLIEQSADNFPYHILLLFEILLPDGTTKMLLLEKNNCINICETFIINQSHIIRKLDLTNKNNKMITSSIQEQDSKLKRKYINNNSTF